MNQESSSTPLPVIANVSRIVTMVTDRITGDRSDYPLLVALAANQALALHGIKSNVIYGQAAWIEILENNSIQWAGCWGDSLYFWIETQFGEIVDLNASVAWKKRAHSAPSKRAVQSPPILWSPEVPRFYRYHPEGLAEVELHDSKDQKKLNLILEEIQEKCQPGKVKEDEEFPNEPILCPGRKLLDDSKENFKLFDQFLSEAGIPEGPF